MASTKAGGSSDNLNDSNPKYLGIKISDGGVAKIGQIIVRQRGTKILPGANTRVGKDHTIFAMKDGKVSFGSKRKQNFDGSVKRLKIVSVVV